ncbi:MAG: NAD-dependent epimerase/dehydratase family protein [Deltaproteobacteria bacterium]|nr:NAD-dependent epimerase/dehydratase family protein [Deltaproteobacteria bacterium]
MSIIDKTKPVLVTGGTGYVASWIIKMLLEDGINVNATVRDPSNVDKVRHLTALAKTTEANLELFKADLLVPSSFDEPMQGCELVMHTASPFIITGIKNPEKELIQPAREGTRNVLEAANRTPTMKRLVLTSSVVAIYGDNADIASAPGGIFTEKEWNTTSSADHQPYAYSKTVAEKDAWAIAGEQDQWDLLTINPGWVLGPSLSRRTDSTSISTMIQFGDGTFKTGVPELWNGIVDVRDIASAHIKAGYTPGASGRHIVASGEATLLDLANILRKHFGDDYPFPRRQAPKIVFWLTAPFFGHTRKYVSKNVGVRIKFDTAYSKSDLGMSYIPIEETVKSHFQQILDDGLLAKKSRGS